MELHDMGTTPTETDSPTVAQSLGGNKKKYYPRTSLSSDKLPGIEDLDIGDKIKLCSVAKIIGKREQEDGKVEVEVETLQCGIMDDKVSEDEYKDMSEEEKDKADEKEVMDEK